MVQERVLWLDVARGIGILLVVFGHVCTEPTAARFVYSFHMPLFFFLAGITRSFSGGAQNVRRRARRLLLPYFLFSIACFAYWALLESHFRPGHYSVPQAFANIFLARGDGFIYNSVLWFLPCLFVLEVVLTRYMLLANVLCLFVVAAYVLANGNALVCGVDIRSIKPFWMLDAALAALPFYMAGYHAQASLLCRGNCDKRTGNAVRLAIVLCCLAFVALFSQKTDLALLVFPSAGVFFSCTALGIYAVIQLSRMAENTRFLQYLGEISLYLMCIHEPVKRIVLKIMGYALHTNVDGIRNDIVLSVVATLAVVVICIPLCRYLAGVQKRFGQK